jgi:hypothetical protein
MELTVDEQWRSDVGTAQGDGRRQHYSRTMHVVATPTSEAATALQQSTAAATADERVVDCSRALPPRPPMSVSPSRLC